MKNVPKYVRYIGDGEAGLEYGDVVKVLCAGSGNNLYVETPKNGGYCGDSADNPTSLKGKKFIYINSMEYEPIKEEKKVEKCNKFKVGDIVRGNSKSIYSYTNEDMVEGVVTAVGTSGFFSVKIIKHAENHCVGIVFDDLDSKYFDLVKPIAHTNTTETISPEILYHITTDMKTFVNIEHNGNKGWSKCDLRYDEFDIHVGIDIAMDRLEKIENPPAKKELPKYVRYIGNIETCSGLVEGDICRVLSGVVKEKALHEDALFVVCPNTTVYNGRGASNPSALKGHNFDYLYPHEYEIVNIHE